MRNNELVSVIIPTYYRNDDLQATLRSVVDHPYTPIEVIVVDDSGEGYAESVIETFDGIKYIPLSENVGPQEARNIGIERSNGRYLQLLDDDDIILDRKLSKQVDVFQERNNVGGVYCGLRWGSGGPSVLPDRRVRGDVLEQTLRFQTSPCAMGTMLIDRNAIKRILPLKHHHGADDIGMKIELARVTEFDFVDEVLVYRGNSEESRSTSLTSVDGRKQILSMCDDLYAEFPASVRRAALAETYLVQGQIQLNRDFWSPAAIASFARACYYIPGLRAPYIGSLFASFFGRTVYGTARSFYSQFVLGDDRRGKNT